MQRGSYCGFDVLPATTLVWIFYSSHLFAVKSGITIRVAFVIVGEAICSPVRNTNRLLGAAEGGGREFGIVSEFQQLLAAIVYSIFCSRRPEVGAVDVRWVLSFLKSARFGISHNKESYLWFNMFVRSFLFQWA